MYYSVNYGYNVVFKEAIPFIAQMVVTFSSIFCIFIIFQVLMSVRGGPILVLILCPIIGPISLMGALNMEKHFSEMFLF